MSQTIPDIHNYCYYDDNCDCDTDTHADDCDCDSCDFTDDD